MTRKTAATKTTENKTAIRGRMFIALLQIQQTYPTLRLGQIIGNACSKDIYYESDEDLVQALEAYAKGSHSSPAERNESRG